LIFFFYFIKSFQITNKHLHINNKTKQHIVNNIIIQHKKKSEKQIITINTIAGDLLPFI